MRVLAAPNAFKGSLSAAQAAEAICRGLRKANPQCFCELFPVGDGGDGTGSLLLDKLGGRNATATARDPLGRPVVATYGLADGDRLAIVELAEASGLRRLSEGELNPLHATTYGTGELIRRALDAGVQRVLLAIGGSATVDGGAGILSALGVRFLDSAGRELAGIPESLARLATIELRHVDARLKNCEMTLLCDVDNPLLGELGAARVFGPQKGASPADVEKLESALTQFSVVIHRQTGVDTGSLAGGGAAGGVAAGLHALLNAKLVKGIDYFLDATGFDQALERCDLVITGEGRLDLQTLQGKGPMGAARRARRKSIRVIALAGSVAADARIELSRHFDEVLEINPPEASLETAIRETAPNLERAAFELGTRLSTSLRR